MTTTYMKLPGRYQGWLKFLMVSLLLCGFGLAHAQADCDNDGDPGDPSESGECVQPPPPPPPPDPLPPAPPPGGCGGGGGGGDGGCSGDSGGAPPPDCPGQAGDPVDCFTGLFKHVRRDLRISDVSSLVVQRTYRSKDAVLRSFGIGASLSYDLHLESDATASNPGTFMDLVLPDGGRIRHLLAAPTTSILAAVYVVAGTPAAAYGGSSIHATSANYVLTRKDGSILTFGPYNGTNYRTSSLIASTDRLGNRTTYLRDAVGNLLTATSPNGRHLFFKYDTSNRITEVDDDSGRKVTYQYWPSGELKSATDPLNYTESYTYDANHNMLAVTDKRGNNMVTNVYDPTTQRVMQQTYAKGTPAEASSSFAYTFDGNGNVTRTDFTDERGNVRRMQFNFSGYVTKRIEAFGKPEQQTTTYTRDLVTNQVLTLTDALGRVTGFTYDGNDNVLSKTLMQSTAMAATWSYTYDAVFNQLISATDPLGRASHTSLDGFGNPQQITDDLNHGTTLSYDPQGRLQTVVRQTGSKSLTTTNAYNGPDLLSITDPLSRKTVFDVDELGRVTGIRDAAGQLSKFYYDAQDQLIQRCDPNGSCASLQYDPNGNLLQFVLGSTERDYTYDERNRPRTEGRAAVIEVTLDYEPGGTVKTRTEASGRIVVISSLDGLGNPLHVDIKTGSPAVVQRTRDMTWDAGNRLKTLSDSVSGNLSYTYDDRFDAIKTETGPTGTMSYGYYANGLLQTTTPSGGTAITRGFDAANRLTTLGQAAGSGSAQPASALSVGLAYDDANRRSRLTLANGITLDYVLDDASQLSTMTWKLGGTTLGDLAYGLDTLGRRTSLSGSLANSNLPSAVTLTVGADGRVATENGTALSYDSNGRLTQDASFTYVWNELGQLSQVRNLSDNALRASFQYDAIGRRYSKTLDGATTKYLHDGANPIQMQNAAGTPTENLLAGGIDEWFSRTTGGQTQHYLSDALGSTLQLTDGTGAKLVSYTYDPYGGTTNDNPASTNRFQYTGRENDGLGLYFNRARYLKPKWGRFISQDPIGLGGADNLYAYVGGSPLSYTDPRGLNPVAGAIEGAELGAEAGSFFGPVGTVVGVVVGAGVGAWLGWNVVGPMFNKPPDPLDSAGGSEHTNGARPSTEGTHEDGEARRKRDRGGEDGDSARDWPRRRPDGWKGPWPPKPKTCP